MHDINGTRHIRRLIRSDGDGAKPCVDLRA